MPKTEDPVAKIQALAAEAREQARLNRERCPEIARIVDLFKAAFGADQIRVTYVREGNHTRGTPFHLPPDRTIAVADMVFSSPCPNETETLRRSRLRSRK
jgi:hypothetical protein